jgi:hypothetical protein
MNNVEWWIGCDHNQMNQKPHLTTFATNGT